MTLIHHIRIRYIMKLLGLINFLELIKETKILLEEIEANITSKQTHAFLACVQSPQAGL